MSFAALISPLVVSGSRKSDGSANDSGQVWAFTPGTNTVTAIYADANASTVVTQPITLDAGGRINYSDYPDGVYATGPIRLYIEDSSGAVVTDTTFIPATAGDVGVDNSGFTGSTLDAVLSAAVSSLGGNDWQYKESSGATVRLIQDKYREVGISVKDFGAVGDGINIDTTPFQTALNRAIALSCPLIVPAGTYKIDQAITGTPTGVRIIGAGFGVTTISLTNSSANCFTLTTPTSGSIENLTITHASSTTGYAVSISGGSGFLLRNVVVTGTGYARGLNTSGNPGNLRVENSSLIGSATAIYLSTVTTCTILSTAMTSSGGACLTIDSTTANVFVAGCNFVSSAANGVLFNSGASGTQFTFIGNFNIQSCTTPINTSALSTDPRIRQFGNQIEQSTTSSAVGAAQTPTLMAGRHVRLTAASGGAGTVTVNAPTILPGMLTDILWTFSFVNASGGAVTWTLNSVFKTTASIPSTDGHTIEVVFVWDNPNQKLREVSRADTTT